MSETHDPIDLQGQENAREDRAQKTKIAEQSEVEDTRWLMSSKRGRRIVMRVLDRAGVFRSSFNTNSMSMAFAEGCRNEGLRVLAQVHAAAPDKYMLMMEEAKE